MGMLNRIVNISVLVLAVVAVVFGYLLFQKREQLVKRGDKMGKMISDVSRALDTNSGTKIADNLVMAKLELDAKKDPKANENAKKSLYHTNYDNLETVLAPFKKQASDVAIQRDTLGVALLEVSKKLEMVDTYKADDFTHVLTYLEKKDQLLATVEKINARDNDLCAQIAASAGVIGFTLDKDSLKNLENYGTPLKEFGSKVEALKKRSDTYAEGIAKICGILQINAPKLDGDDYAAEIATSEKAVQNYKDEFEKTKQELARTKEELKKSQDDLSKATAKIDVQNKEIAKLKKQLADYITPPEDGGESQPGPAQAKEDSFYEKLEGKILDVNSKWEFVVIDLGKNNKLVIGDKKKVEKTVPLPEGKTMMVGRGNEYLGKIKVIRVNDNCAIANILPDQLNGKIEPGDKVFFAKALPQEKIPGAAAGDKEKPAPEGGDKPAAAPADEPAAAPAADDAALPAE